MVSGKEWHKWCYQKMKGDKGPVARKVEVSTCPVCDEAIEDGQEKTVRKSAHVRVRD